MKTRRTFLKQAALGTTAISLPMVSVFGNLSPSKFLEMKAPKISLAQWSLHRALEKGNLLAIDFASISKDTYGIHAVEYVNQFYMDHATDEGFWNTMKERADDSGVKSLLIMVDNEGDLGNPKDKERKKAVENHYKWINAAKILGCHSIRVNAFGQGTKAELKQPLISGLGTLAEYGAQEKMNVLIENHGLHTSDGKYITDIIKAVANPYLGTLPDFGNWCLNKEWGSTQNNACDQVYDRHQGLADFLPYAKGVSAKSYDFDTKGNETVMDYVRLLQMVKDSDFDGYIGIEFEGENMNEPEGIRATKALIERVWANLN
ncbi:TIM barrel protein [Ulvibacterium sp.]|uniref:sugar phosphate isomerase/epimerase family protein n=1 Tax=Ulvibacterium sp. TaxID=2665914 RepID=UPI002611E4B6|nr:TIM barrel protein [Ulvibacterium sp.]